MEETTQTANKLRFTGNGSELLGLFIANILLTIITLGFYFPWAKASVLRYMYSHTELNNEHFTFHGTGKEMFKGFIFAYLLFIVLALPMIIGAVTKDKELYLAGYFGFLFAILLILPMAIHGRLKFRTSRSSYRGIYFGYDGNMGKLYGICISGFLLSIITFGIYGSWMTVNIRKYIFQSGRFGNIRFDFKGEGGSLFGTYLGGYLLSIITFFIYSFKWMSNIFSFYVDNTRMEQDGNIIRFKSTTTGLGIFKLLIVNVLIIIFTLGFGTSYATVRSMKYFTDNIQILGDLQLDNLVQGEVVKSNALGEQLAEALGMGF